MNKGKLILYEMATSCSTTDENTYVPVKFQKNKGRIGGKLKQDEDSTRLQELSLMNNTHVCAIYYDIHLDMKLHYTISRIFQKLSFTELETLHQLCELEGTQILQSLALAVLKKKPLRRIFIVRKQIRFYLTTKEIFYGIRLVTKKVSPSYVFEDKRCYKKIPIFYTN